MEDDFAAAHMLKGRILEAQGDKTGARQRYRRALELAPDLFDGRHARAVAAIALQGAGRSAARPGRWRDVVDHEPGRKVGCKRFLPTTGTIIEASCGE